MKNGFPEIWILWAHGRHEDPRGGHRARHGVPYEAPGAPMGPHIGGPMGLPMGATGGRSDTVTSN